MVGHKDTRCFESGDSAAQWTLNGPSGKHLVDARLFLGILLHVTQSDAWKVSPDRISFENRAN